MKNLCALANVVLGCIACIAMLCMFSSCDVSMYRNNPLRVQFEASRRAREPIELVRVVQRGVRVQLFAPDTLQIGYTTMFVQLTDLASSKVLETGSVQIVPMLRTALHDRTAPVQDASLAAVSSFGAMRFPCNVLLLERGNYELIIVWSAAGKHDTARVLVPVGTSWRVVQVRGSDSRIYLLTFAEPQRPRVGVQDFSVFVHCLDTSMHRNHEAYIPVSDLQLHHEPTMPSMGHGSEGNVPLVHRAHGRYDGKISFNMTGDWRIDMTAWRGNSLLFETLFFFIL